MSESNQHDCGAAFVLSVTKNQLTVRRREPVTSGSVNVCTARFEFGEDWDGLERVAAFRAGDQARSVPLDESNVCTVPWEVLAVPGVPLLVGVYGTRGEEVVLPTVWASVGTILHGAAPGPGTQPPTPDLWERELAKKGDKLEYDGSGLSLTSGGTVLDTVQLGGGLPEGGEIGQVLTKTDAGAEWADQAAKNIYSLDETVVGRWIDGRPIYQLSVQYSVAQSGAFNIHTFPEEINLIEATGYAVRSDSHHTVALPFPHASYWIKVSLNNFLCGYPFCSAERERAIERDRRSTKAVPKPRRLKRKEYSSR